MVRWTELLPLKTDHPGVGLVTGDLGGLSDQYSISANDIRLFSMVKDTDGPTVWSDGPQNKYNPAFCD